MSWVMRNAHNISIGNPEWTIPHERLISRWELKVKGEVVPVH